MMASTAALPCIHPGCTDGRYVTTNGVTYARCQTHQREYWARIKVPTPGIKPRGPKRGTTYAKKPDAAPEAKPTPKVAPVPKRGGAYEEDVPMQFVVLREGEGFYEVYLAVVVDRRAFDEVRTPARVRQRYSDCIAIVEKSGVLG